MILVFNAGSSKLASAVFNNGNREPDYASMAGGAPGQAAAMVLRELEGKGLLKEVRAVGHRVVHGGTEFRGAVLIDDQVKESIARLGAVAPLHNPAALDVVAACEAALPGVPQAAAFDTAFFAGLDAVHAAYPLPYEWFARRGLRRFGFHGINHEYCARRATKILGRSPGGPRLVICHLGNGCSAAAVQGGKPVATTMGFTPLEGLMMGTRSGSVDPGLMLHLLKSGMRPEDLEETLQDESGLLGVSGISWDYREVESAAADGNARARLALDMFADRTRAAVGALSVTLGGLDALVFTGGIGQNSASAREAICRGLECLGVRLDPERNASIRHDADVAAEGSPARVLVLRAQEELMIARLARKLLKEAGTLEARV